MAKPKTDYPEITEIREDLNSLKSNVVELTKHLKHDGDTTIEEIRESATKRLKNLSTAGQKKLKEVEGHVKAKPAQSLAMAFAAGLVISALARR